MNAQGGFFGVPLIAASMEGYLIIVKSLRDAGADVNTQGGTLYGNALQAAIFNRGMYRDADSVASQKDYEAIVRILLKAGANVNTQGGKYGNALGAAPREDRVGMELEMARIGLSA